MYKILINVQTKSAIKMQLLLFSAENNILCQEQKHYDDLSDTKILSMMLIHTIRNCVEFYKLCINFFQMVLFQIP